MVLASMGALAVLAVRGRWLARLASVIAYELWGVLVRLGLWINLWISLWISWLGWGYG